MLWKRNRNTCGYWDCDKRLPHGDVFCAEHYEDWEEGTLDRCPKCGRFKDVMYYLCLDCYFGRPVAHWEPPATMPTPKQYYKVEYSQAWTDGFRQPDRVFVYILKFADEGLYAGHTTDIRKRLSEYRDVKIPFTAGGNPELRYLEFAANQKAAELRQDELKRLIATNPDQIQLMINEFQDRMREFGVD